MNRRLASLLAVVLMSVSSVAFAQETPPPPPPPLESAGDGGGGGAWSVYSGRTLGSGNAFAAEVGWPGLNAMFLHAVSSGFDIGGKFTFNYGTEITFGISPGIALNAELRFGLLNKGIFSMSLLAEPGLGFFFTNGAGMIIYIPVALQMGVHPISALTILVGVELRPQIIIAFGGGGGAAFGMPMLFVNPGVEYALTNNLLLTFRMALGPGVIAAGNGGGVGFSFRAMMGVAIKL
jgi:hypothetical protein